jgi:hypothetical protein
LTAKAAPVGLGSLASPNPQRQTHMPKKKVISMFEFLRTGSFGGLSNGASIAELKPNFGKPLYEKENEDLTGKWVYEDVDIYTNLETQKVWGFVIWGFRNQDEFGGFPLENKKFRIDPWLLRWQLGLVNTINALKSENLNFLQLPNAPIKGYETLKLESGTEIIFSDDFDLVNGKFIPANPTRLVYDAILNINLKYAVTKLNSHLKNQKQF